jgi:hypothetical protein
MVVKLGALLRTILYDIVSRDTMFPVAEGIATREDSDIFSSEAK